MGCTLSGSPLTDHKSSNQSPLTYFYLSANPFSPFSLSDLRTSVSKPPGLIMLILKMEKLRPTGRNHTCWLTSSLGPDRPGLLPARPVQAPAPGSSGPRTEGGWGGGGAPSWPHSRLGSGVLRSFLPLTFNCLETELTAVGTAQPLLVS